MAKRRRRSATATLITPIVVIGVGTAAALFMVIMLGKAKSWVGSTPALLDTSTTDAIAFSPGTIPTPLDATHWRLDFPKDSPLSGGFTGENIISLLRYHVSRVDFDATFISNPNVLMTGFDEYAIFMTNTLYYDGTEFGIRCDIKSGVVFAYTQESSPSFHQVPLIINDQRTHHYTILLDQNSSTFLVDGTARATLWIGRPYSSSTFWATILAHRYTSGWDSTGFHMDMGDFRIS